MSSAYAGNPSNDPVSITIPSDGDGPGIKAADVNPAFEGLADRTANVKARVILMEAAPALNFREMITISLRIDRARFCPATSQWMAIGTTTSSEPAFCRTTDPSVWPTVTEITDTSFPSAIPSDFAVSDAGKIVVVDGQIDWAWLYNGATWAINSGPFGNDPASFAQVVWDRPTGLFCAAFRVGAVPYIVTSNDNGASWSPHTIPTGSFTSFVGCSLETDGAGTIWMQCFYSTGTVAFSKSVNGGVSWSALQTVAIAAGTDLGSTDHYPKPAFDGTNWGAVVPADTAGSCAILKLVSGTWTLVHNYVATLCVASLAAHPNGQWAGLTKAGSIVVSQDGLSTFETTDFGIVIASPFLFSHKNLHCDGIRFVFTGRTSAASATGIWFSGGVGTGIKEIPTS